MTDDIRESLAQEIAQAMGGWNEDTTELTLEGPVRAAAEAHWARVNAECIRQGREYADAILARFTVTEKAEPEWEYAVRDLRGRVWFKGTAGARPGDMAIRRRPAGPWEEVPADE